MADEKGKIKIEVEVDPSDAVEGLQKLQNVLGVTEEDLQSLGKTTVTEAAKSGDAIEERAEKVIAASKQENQALENSAEVAQQTAKKKRKALDNADQVKGLDELKDASGELDSSLKGLGGAVGLVSPNMERMLFVTGELSGGVEASARLTTLFKGSMGALIGPVGLVGAGVLAAGAALWAWSKRAKKAKIDNSELEGSLKALADAQTIFLDTADELAVLEGRTTSYRAQLARLGETVEKEFADKLKEANDPFAEFQEAVDDAADAIKNGEERMEMLRNTMKLGGEAADSAAMLLSQQTREMSRLGVKYKEALDAQNAALSGSSEEAKARRELIAGIEEEEENRRKILRIRIEQEDQSEIQSRLLTAQSKNDREAIRSISREMAQQADVFLSSKIAAMKWAASTKIAFLEASGMAGPALVAMSSAINAQTAALVANALEEAKFETIYRRNLEGMENRTSATEDGTDADAAAAEEERKRLRVLDMLAEAQGELAVIEHNHTKALKEIEELNEALGLSEEELATLTEGAIARRKAAIESLAQTNEGATGDRRDEIQQLIALEKSQAEEIESSYSEQQGVLLAHMMLRTVSREEAAAKIVEIEKKKNKELAALNKGEMLNTLNTAKMLSEQFTTLIETQMQARLQKLRREEEAALAEAEGSVEAQEKIREDFAKKRSKELSDEFKLRQGLEISNAIISGASAAIAALAPPPVGAGPVVGAFMATAIAATTAAQIGIIANETPSFHQGGIVGGDGDRQITAQGGEVVLNRDAVAAMGGAAAANNLNRGGGMGGPLVVQMTYRNRVFDQMVLDNLAKGGPLKKALGRATRRGRRGRIGGRL